MLTLLAFQELFAKKIEICVDEQNIKSLRIPEKLSFKLECRRKGGWPRPDGYLAELLTFSVFSPEDPPKDFFFKVSY